MIFEIPIQHFPPKKIAEERPESSRTIIRRAKCKLFAASCVELSKAMAEKPEVVRPRVSSYFENLPAVQKITITRSQSVPAVPRERQLSRAERVQKSMAAFARRVSTLMTIPTVNA